MQSRGWARLLLSFCTGQLDAGDSRITGLNGAFPATITLTAVVAMVLHVFCCRT